MTAIGEKIASLRREANMTQADLGDALCVTAQAISKWERGQAEPDISTLLRIAELFHVSTDELLKGDAISASDTPPAEEESPLCTEAEPAAEATPAPVQEKTMEEPVGNCAVCKQPVLPDEVGKKTPALLCKKCLNRNAPVGTCMTCGQTVTCRTLATKPPIIRCQSCAEGKPKLRTARSSSEENERTGSSYWNSSSPVRREFAKQARQQAQDSYYARTAILAVLYTVCYLVIVVLLSRGMVDSFLTTGSLGGGFSAYWALTSINQIVCTIACLLIASRKGRNGVGWLFGGLFLGNVGLLIISFLSDKE